MSKDEITSKIGISAARTTMDLLRLQEEGKIESRIVDGKRVWSIKKVDESLKKLEKRTK